MPVPLTGAGKNHGWHGNVVLVREAVVHDTHQINCRVLNRAVRLWLTLKPNPCTCASLPRILAC